MRELRLKERAKNGSAPLSSGILSVIAGVAAVFSVSILLMWILPFPQLKAFQNRQYSTRFYDRYGSLLQISSLNNGIRREWTPLEDIPPEFIEVFINAEDQNFYGHHGVDCASVIRALKQNLESGKTVSGASTITMQLARIIVPRKTAAVSLGDKLVEALRAIRLELKLSKHQILELYLNNLPFGFRTEGVTSAARNFYGCTLQELTFSQMQVLSLVPRRPSQYSRLLPSKSSYSYSAEAPHFIEWVKEQYKGKTIPPDVYLSVSNPLLSEITHLVAQTVSRYESARVSDGAAFVLDNCTGEILAWCGSTDFYREDTGQIDGVRVCNQAGSSMKPFLYAAALERGILPATVLADVPSDFGVTEVYVPQNFNNRFNGPQLLRTCLASSLNIPAVYLLYSMGIDSYMSVLEKLGFDSLKKKKDVLGLSLALGAGEVPLYELVRAFSVFARDGTVPRLEWLRHDAGFTAETSSVIYKSDTARIICDMLSDKNARALGFGLARVFDTPYPAIFKTGTSNQFQNIVALGSTKKYSVGVWMGNVTGQTVIGETGSSIPATIVRAVLDMLESTNPAPAADSVFLQPERYEKQKICALSGMKPCAHCPLVTEEYVPVNTARDECTWHYTSGGVSFVKYPDEYQRWLGGRNMNGGLQYSGSLHFFYPQLDAVFLYDPTLQDSKQKLRVDVAGGSEDNATLYVDGVFAGESARPFFWYIPIIPGSHTLSVLSGDEQSEITVHIK